MNDNQTILFAFLLTLFAGLSTLVGSAIAFFASRTNKNLLSVSLGFSAGVMLYVSFVELLAEARESLTKALGENIGNFVAIGAFFGGIVFMGLIDHFVPQCENPHEVRSLHDLEVIHSPKADAGELEEMKAACADHRLLRLGLFTALAIAIHNFPEGLATFTAAMAELKLGISIAIAIAIHNIPEGISIAVPLFFATNSRGKSVLWSLLSGLAEPVGAILGFLLLRAWLSPQIFGMIFGGVAGIMVYISLDELLPTARVYGKGHLVIYGTVLGMAVMAVSLLLLD